MARGATIYAEVAGAASTADAHHITAPAPDGAGAVACMELALGDAGIGPSDVGHINAHGTSTPLNDLAEARAMRMGGTMSRPDPARKRAAMTRLVRHKIGAALVRPLRGPSLRRRCC